MSIRTTFKTDSHVGKRFFGGKLKLPKMFRSKLNHSSRLKVWEDEPCCAEHKNPHKAILYLKETNEESIVIGAFLVRFDFYLEPSIRKEKSLKEIKNHCMVILDELNSHHVLNE